MKPHIKEEQFSAYLDRQLSTGETRELEQHLEGCPECRTACDEMRDVSGFFREMERAEPSAFLWTRIEANLGSMQSERGWRTRLLGLRSQLWGPGLAALGMVFMLVVGAVVFQQNSRHVADQAALAEIDKTYKILLAQDAESYNPFSTPSSFDTDSNPFRSMRLTGKIDDSQSKIFKH